jgi:hypothetical protein
LIIACPECTSPFQVLDDQIAPLLQIECPSCRFRMILDFAAANDAGLREEGMQYAQGFRDEATYRQAVGAGEVSYATTEPPAAKPELRAVPEPTVEPEPEPVVEQPAAEQPAAEPVRRPVFTPAPEPTHAAPVTPAPTPTPVQPEPARAKPPVRARPTLIAQTAPPPVRQPAELIPPRPAEPEAPKEAAIDTHVGPPPVAEVAAPVEVPRPADEAQLEVPADEFSVELDEPEVEPETRPVVRPEPQLRTPPHTPATPSTPKPVPDEATDATTDIPPAVEDTPKDEQTGKRGGALRTVFLMFLLLLLMGAAGLMGWSVIETQNPNPLPMLKDKFGIDLGFGIPAQPADDNAVPPIEGKISPDKTE